MLTDRDTKARYLAYRWFRTRHLDATHPQAWDFAQGKWREFLVLLETQAPQESEKGNEHPPAVA